jgi:hypothetical protein
VKLLKKHDGFILFEALTSLTISLIIILTLTICISEQFKLINDWEMRVTAHQFILQHLRFQNFPKQVMVKNKIYYFQKDSNKYQVTVNQHVYQVNK